MVKIGIVGAGLVAAEHILGWRLADCEVLIAADPDPHARDMIAKFSNIATVASLDDLLQFPIDVIDLCTPHHEHFQQLKSLENWPGAILIQKPVVTSVEHLRQLKSVIENRSRPVVMRTNKRFEPHVQSFQQLLNTIDAGARIRLKVEWHQKPSYMAERPWYRRVEVSGGGIVLGMGIHYLDILAEHLVS